MAQTRPITITLVVDADGAVRGVQSVSGQVHRLGRDFDGTGQKAVSFGRTVEVAFGVIAANAAAALATALQGVIARGTDLLKTAGVIEEVGLSFDRTFGQMTSRMDTFVSEWANMAGLTELEARKLIGITGSVADGMGMAEDARADLSMGVAKLAGDIAAYRAVEPERVFHALTGALVGNSMGLRQFGIVINQEEVKLRALANTGKQNADQLTQQERALATLEIAYQRAGNAVGHLESHQDAAFVAGQRANAQWRQIVETFTAQLIPAATAINAQLAELTSSDELSDWARRSGETLSNALVRGLQLAIDLVELLIKHRDGIAFTARAVGVLTLAVVAYIATVRGLIAVKMMANRWILTYTGSIVGMTGAKIAARAATVQLMAAVRAFFVALRANPVGLFVAAITAAITYLALFRTRTDESTQALQRKRDAALEAADAVRELSGAAAGARLVEIEVDLVMDRARLQTLREDIRDLERSRGGAGLSEWREAGQRLNEMRQEAALLHETIQANERSQSALNQARERSLSAQIAYTEEHLRLERDRAALTDDERSYLAAIAESERQIRDDATISADEAERRLTALSAADEVTRRRAMDRVDTERVEELETQLGLLHEQRAAVEAIGREEERNATTTTTTLTDQQRRNLADRERELQRMRVEVMADGLDKTLALIDLEFREREARMRERYGQLTQEEIRLVREQRARAIAAAFGALIDDDLPVIEFDVAINYESIEEASERFARDMELGALRTINQVDDALAKLEAQWRGVTTQEARDEIMLLIERLRELREEMLGIVDTGVDIGAQLEGVVSSAISDLASLIGEGIAGLEDENVGARILDMLLGMARRIGEILVATGVGMLALRAVIANPIGAIVSGAALIALAAAGQAAIQRTLNNQSATAPEPPRYSNQSATYTPFGGARRYGGTGRAGFAYLTGEEGPELFLAPHDGHFLPASATRAVLSGQSGASSTEPREVRVVVDNSRRIVHERIEVGPFTLLRTVEEAARIRDKHLGRS